MSERINIVAKWFMQLGFAALCLVLIVRDWHKDQAIIEFQQEQVNKQHEIHMQTAESIQKQTAAIEKLEKAIILISK